MPRVERRGTDNTSPYARIRTCFSLRATLRTVQPMHLNWLNVFQRSCVCSSKVVPAATMSLLGVPEVTPFPPVCTWSTTTPTPLTGIRPNPGATPLWGGPSGHLADPTPNTKRLECEAEGHHGTLPFYKDHEGLCTSKHQKIALWICWIGPARMWSSGRQGPVQAWKSLQNRSAVDQQLNRPMTKTAYRSTIQQFINSSDFLR